MTRDATGDATRDAKLDIRYPLGALFTVLGGVLAAYGYATRHDAELYIPSGDLNVNLGWGLVLLLLGVLLLAIARRAARRATETS